MLDSSLQHSACDRRRFLELAVVAGSGLLLSGGSALAAVADTQRTLSFYNIHTREALESVYWRDGRYLPEALSAIDYHLRDFRTGEVRPIDCRLLDLLADLNRVLHNDDPLHVISGYRCAATNAMLARRSRAVSTNSYHLRGMAIDIRLPTRHLRELRDGALHLAAGGVGYYPESDFVHVDTGPARSW